MHGRQKTLFVLLTSLLVVAPLGDADGEVSNSVARTVASSVTQITAESCVSGPTDRTGSGFVFRDGTHVVTALHVVSGCETLEVLFEGSDGGKRLKATVIRILESKDLALLELAESSGAVALEVAADYDRNADLKAIGYAVEQPTLGDVDLRISIGKSKLRDFLPPGNKAELAATKIDLNQIVLRFKSALYPGMSGGPIFDETGEVVAIVAGGLKSGAVAASWGWHASNLYDLENSDEALQSSSVASTDLFAYPSSENEDKSLTCGDLEFRYQGKLTFGEISKSTDNIVRLNTTMAFSGRPKAEIDAFEFEIWVHEQSGATLVTPASMETNSGNSNCSVRSPDGVMEQVVWGSIANGTSEIGAAALQFEKEIMFPRAQQNIGWYADTVLSFYGPEYRQDGLVVNRKAYFIGKVDLGNGRYVASHQFETLIARSGTFVGVSTINNRVEQCLNAYGQFQLCSYDPEFVKQWTHFVLATQLTTYPVY